MAGDTGVQEWPELAAAALRRGWGPACAWPMWLADRQPAALVAVWQGPNPPSTAELDAGGWLAVVLARHLDVLQELHQARTTSAHLQRALTSRVVIEQAKGRLAATLDLSPDGAFDRLRRYARDTRRRLHDVAREVLDGTLDLAA